MNAMWGSRSAVVILAIAAAAFLPSVARAQSQGDQRAAARLPLSSFATLGGAVKLGDQLCIVDARGTEHKGRVAELSSSSLVVISSGKREEYQESAIDRILRDEDDPISNGAWTGFGIGAAIGALTALPFVAQGDANVGGAIGMTATIGGIGAAMGAGFDALSRDTTTVYKRAAATTSLQIAPVVSSRIKGVRFVVRWGK
jgi:hypothetical protein